jgi:hypothetical protein
MKPIERPLLAAAVLTTALTSLAFGQLREGQNPGSGGTSPDPSNETPTTNASGARTEALPDARVGGRYGVNGNADVDPNRPRAITDAELNSIHAQEESRPKNPKRSFWDRLLGRNKHLEADRPAADSGKDDYQP